jgi:hypothetical protein
MCSASNELWRIVKEGYKLFDAKNPTRRDVVDSQLNSIALNMVQQAVSSKDLPYIVHFTTAKEAWECLSAIFVAMKA